MLYWKLAPVDLFARGGFILSQQHLRTDQFFGNTNSTDNNTDFAWGFGAQVHFDKLAVRLEYERFELDARPGFEPPNMISLGASWTFF